MAQSKSERLAELINAVSHCAMAYAQNQHDEHCSRRLSDAEKALRNHILAHDKALTAAREAISKQVERLVEIAQELKSPRMPLQTAVDISVRFLAEDAQELLTASNLIKEVQS